MKYLNKKVSVDIPSRDKYGKISTGKTTIVGICQLEPIPNPLLNIPLQTVINRMPIELNSLNDLKIMER